MINLRNILQLFVYLHMNRDLRHTCIAACASASFYALSSLRPGQKRTCGRHFVVLDVFSQVGRLIRWTRRAKTNETIKYESTSLQGKPLKQSLYHRYCVHESWFIRILASVYITAFIRITILCQKSLVMRHAARMSERFQYSRRDNLLRMMLNWNILDHRNGGTWWLSMNLYTGTSYTGTSYTGASYTNSSKKIWLFNL